MPVNTRLPEVDEGHPILEAIAGFREVVNRLIDEQKAGLLTITLEPEADFAADSTGPRLTATEVAAAAPPPSRTRTAAPISPSPRPESFPVARPPALPLETAEPTTTPHSDDPRQRLDALAKLLDRRRKPAGSATIDASSNAVEEKESP